MLWLLTRGLSGALGFLMAGVAGLLLVEGLYPFVLAPAPRDFGWVPFWGFFRSSPLFALAIFAKKVFFYGLFLWLGRQLGIPLALGALLGALLTATIEVAQLFFRHHTPEITDPLLVILTALAIHLGSSPRRRPMTTP